MNQILDELKEFSITKYGFYHNESPLELPESFKEWKDLRINLPKLLVNESLVNFIDAKLKVIECDSFSLPEKYLKTASVYISHFSHAYAYEIRRKKQDPKQDINFPDCIEIPWQNITTRLGRDHPQVLFYDFFSWNFYDDDQRTNQIFFNFFTSNTAEKFTKSFALVDKTLGISAPYIYAIHSSLSKNTLTYDDLNSHLYKMINPLYQSTKSMRSMMNTSRFDADFYVNPALWSKTIAPIGGSTRKGEIGMSGGAAPSFKLLDIFFGRKKYDSELGRQILEKTYLKKHREFMSLIESSAKKIIDFISKNRKSLNLFNQLSQLYYGETGYLGLHQKKVYG